VSQRPTAHAKSLQIGYWFTLSVSVFLQAWYDTSMSDNPTADDRRLVIPESIAHDLKAIELVSAWAHSDKVSVMTRTGTGLDENPNIWGEIIVAIAGNIAISLREATGADPAHTLRIIKESIDRAWKSELHGDVKHYRPTNPTEGTATGNR
jgi:hypothetical protein